MGGVGTALSGAASAVGDGAKAVGSDVGQLFKQAYVDPIHQGLYGSPSAAPSPAPPGAPPAAPTAPAPPPGTPAQTPLHTQIMQSLFGPQAQQSGPTPAQRNRQLQATGNN